MRLAELLPGVELGTGLDAVEVTGLTADSRAVQPGFVFFAVPGSRGDGLTYAAAARAAGAVAVVAERSDDGPVVVVPSVRRALSQAAALLYPEQPATIAAVTGTSGKTSVVAFVRQIWAATGARAASLGTLGIVAPEGAVYGSLTTPDPVTLHRDVDRLARSGVTHLAVEASSHGLDQHRLDGLRMAAGAFTNLSRDHLDYHSSVEAYLAAKLRLFGDVLPPGAGAVIDADSEVSGQVIAMARARGLSVMTVGLQGDGIRLLSAEPRGFSTRIAVRHAGRDWTLDLPLAGLFQVFNALVAAGLCIATGTEPERVFATLEHLVGAPGRLERVGEANGAPILIDYAHKPDALDKVLQTLRPYAERRLVVVLGCGGDRDAGKRPMMGEIAARLADVVIVTDDNPRSEDPAVIRSAILAAAPGAIEIGDRAEAIRTAVAMLGMGDVLVVAGKGHETGQTIAGTTLPFSDAEAVAAALAGIAP